MHTRRAMELCLCAMCRSTPRRSETAFSADTCRSCPSRCDHSLDAVRTCERREAEPGAGHGRRPRSESGEAQMTRARRLDEYSSGHTQCRRAGRRVWSKHPRTQPKCRACPVGLRPLLSSHEAGLLRPKRGHLHIALHYIVWFGALSALPLASNAASCAQCSPTLPVILDGSSIDSPARTLQGETFPRQPILTLRTAAGSIVMNEPLGTVCVQSEFVVSCFLRVLPVWMLKHELTSCMHSSSPGALFGGRLHP